MDLDNGAPIESLHSTSRYLLADSIDTIASASRPMPSSITRSSVHEKLSRKVDDLFALV